MKHVKTCQLGLVVVGTLFLGVCAAAPAAQARQTPISWSNVLAGHAQGSTVLWGGQLVKVSYRNNNTCMLIQVHPLGRGAVPNMKAGSPGYFIACKPGKSDPYQVYAGRRLTIDGSVMGTSEQALNGQPYTYPVVAIDQVHLWGRSNKYSTTPQCHPAWQSSGMC